MDINNMYFFLINFWQEFMMQLIVDMHTNFHDNQSIFCVVYKFILYNENFFKKKPLEQNKDVCKMYTMTCNLSAIIFPFSSKNNS